MSFLINLLTKSLAPGLLRRPSAHSALRVSRKLAGSSAGGQNTVAFVRAKQGAMQAQSSATAPGVAR